MVSIVETHEVSNPGVFSHIKKEEVSQLSNVRVDFSSSLLQLTWFRFECHRLVWQSWRSLPINRFLVKTRNYVQRFFPNSTLHLDKAARNLRRFFSCGQCLPLGSAHLMSYPTAPWWLRVFMQPSDPYVGHYNSVAGISKVRPVWRVGTSEGCWIIDSTSFKDFTG